MSRHVSEYEPGPSLVRPYALTEGRTLPSIDLPLEALIGTIDHAGSDDIASQDVPASIVALCSEQISVAEIAAQLGVPIGVVRVLVADLVVAGLLEIHATLRSDTSSDERRELIERTLSGLRAL